MILEYCEEGNLRDWLLRKKDKISDDTIEKLFQMIFGVALGMEYLASKKVDISICLIITSIHLE